MIDNNRAFSGFSVSDINKAREFYGDKLQLKVMDGVMGLLELHVGNGNPIIIYPKENHQPATFTILNFPVENIEEAVAQLSTRGITFERYEGFNQNSKGISRSENGPSIAWFKDPAGNILSIIQPTV
ncbi:VOC family protein [Owenweeksia hongkongensis]|uniref:VOC family protein n=1 Tax=Owenweeksia hongkongensis TaxID=253245 RepID=UPI003A93A97B